MTPQAFWQEYVGEQSPEDFMLAFRSHDAEGCVAAYLAERPNFLGIVRRLTWRDTFAAEVQHTREIVEGSLATYLEETRLDWEPALGRAIALEAAQATRAEQTQSTPESSAEDSAEASPPESTPPQNDNDGPAPAQD